MPAIVVGSARSIGSALSGADLFTPQWAYVARCVAAATLAYGAAYALQLDKPYSAASTVMLVANLNHGAVLAKGGWRLGGTLIGGLASIVVMGLFIQAPMLFLIFFGLWLGVCAAAATVLRHFRATGAAVAGYTMGFATYGALEAPDNAFSIVLARVATVAIGVVCLGLVTALFSKRASSAKLDASIRRQLGAIARFLGDRTPVTVAERAAKGDSLVTGLFEIDDLLEVGRAECPDVARKAGAVREGLAALFGTVMAAREVHATCEMRSELVCAARQALADGLTPIIALVERGQGADLAQALDHCAALRRDLTTRGARAEVEAADAQDLIGLDAIVEAVEDWESGLVGLMRLRGRKSHRAEPFRYNRDWRGAVENGVRAMVGIVLVGSLSLGLGWQGWPLTLLLLAPYGVLMAMTTNPVGGAWSFVRGTLLAVPPAFVCAFWVLPRIDGFALLIIAMLPAWIAGFYATTKPRFAFDGMGFLVAFNTLVLAANPIRYDAPLFFNEALSWVVAVVATLLVLLLILPHAPRRQADRLGEAIRDDVMAAIGKGVRGPRARWEHLQHHRMTLVVRALPRDGDYARALLRQAAGAVLLGRTALRLRRFASQPELAEPVRERVRAALEAASRLKPHAVSQLAMLGHELADLADGQAQDQPAARRATANVRILEALLREHQAWLSRGKVSLPC